MYLSVAPLPQQYSRYSKHVGLGFANHHGWRAALRAHTTKIPNYSTTSERRAERIITGSPLYIIVLGLYSQWIENTHADT
jgi:hypothetical protein